MKSPVPLHLSSRRAGIEFWTLIAIVAAYILWMLSLPCFPSTDGPVHMYYVHVLGALLSHSDARYEHFFHVRHILPPYSLYYYLLLLFSTIFPMLLADRLVICVYFVSFVFGFRYLARAIGPRADLVTIMATLLLLNWPLGMGFLSFCLSLSLALWALGIWLRISGSRNPARRSLFLVLVGAVMLTHPVPLLLVLAVAGSLLFVRFIQSWRVNKRFSWPASGKADLMTLVGSSLNLLYVRLFTNAHPLSQGGHTGSPSFVSEVIARFGYYGREHALSFLYGRRLDLLTYRYGLLLILVLSIAAASWQTRQNVRARVWKPGDTFFVLGSAFMLLIPFVPSKLNDCFYFADRLLICVWIAFLLAASSWSGLQASGSAPISSAPIELPQRNKLLAVLPALIVPVCAAAMLVTTAALLHGADRLLRPAAESVAELETMQGYPVNEIGFVMEDSRKALGSQHENVSWNPYYWALVNVFRSNDAILANAPWMDESIIPVAPSAPLPEVTITALQQPIPSLLQKDLLRSPRDYEKTFSSVQFFISNRFDRPAQSKEPLIERHAETVKDWNCSMRDWYSLCYAPQRAPQTQTVDAVGVQRQRRGDAATKVIVAREVAPVVTPVS